MTVRATVTVSALMPVHAGADPRHFRLALASLFAQTRPLDEVVVVEDGPLGPGHLRALDDAACPELTRVTSAGSLGIAGALNLGLAASGSEWILRMDSDDISYADRLERQLDAVASGGLDVLGTAMSEFRDDPSSSIGIRRMPSNHEAIARYMRRRSPINHPTALYRRALALQVGGYQRIDGVEDYDFFSRLMAEGARFANLDAPLVHYRVTDQLFARRGGRKFLAAEYQLQRNLRAYGLVGRAEAIVNLATRVGYRLLPLPVMRLAYGRMFRTPSSPQPDR
jgi:glycosyltransferase involved in cell wall biosynthesis